MRKLQAASARRNRAADEVLRLEQDLYDARQALETAERQTHAAHRSAPAGTLIMQAHKDAMDTAELANQAKALLDALHDKGWNGLDLTDAHGNSVSAELGLVLLIDRLTKYSAVFRTRVQKGI